MALKLLNLVKNNKFQEFAFFIGLALSRLVWFAGSQGVLMGGDLVVSANPFQFWTSLFSSWSAGELGAPNTALPRIFYPEWATMGLLDRIGLSQATAEMVFVVLFSFVAAFSIFYLARQLFPEKKDRRVAFFATLAYMFSTFIIADAMHTSIMYLPFLALIPLMVLIALKAIKEKSLKYSLALAFVAYFFISPFPNPSWVLLAVIAVVAFGYFQAARAHRLKFYTSFLAISGGIILAANLFWLLPLLSSIPQLHEAGEARPLWLQFNENSSFLAVSRLMSKWGFFGSYEEHVYHSYAHFYQDSLPIVIASFVPTILAFGALALRRRDATVTFLGVFTVVILILATGNYEWFGGYYVFLLREIPVLRSVHESFHWLKLAILLFSLLVGVCLGEVSRRLPSVPLRSVVVGILVSAILLASFPLLTGSVANNWTAPDTKGMNIPAYYTQANHWLRQQEEKEPFSVFVLPWRWWYLRYNWGFQGGSAFLHRSIIVPIISQLPLDYIESPSGDSVEALYNTFYADINPYFGKLLAKYGVKYIMVETNIDEVFYSAPGSGEALSLLSKQKGIREVKRFGDIIILENDYFQGWITANHSAYMVIPFIDDPSNIIWQLEEFRQEDLLIENSSLIWELEEFRQENRLAVEKPVKIIENLTMSAISEGEFLTKEMPIPIAPPVSAQYLLVSFSTNEHSAIALSVYTDEGAVWLDATKPTPVRVSNHYSSIDGTTLIFRLPQTPIKQVNILLGNILNPEYEGRLEASIDYVQMTSEVTLVPATFTADGPVMVDQGVATMSAISEGEFLTKEMHIPIALPVSAQYLVVSFSTNEHSAIALSVYTDEGAVWLDAVNPTPVRINNHYSSPEGTTTLIFGLPQIPIKGVNILLGNMLNPEYEGQLQASIEHVAMAKKEAFFTAEGPVTIDQGVATMSAISEGEYLLKEMYIPIVPSVSARYLSVSFSTNEYSTILVSVYTDQGEEWLDAINPTPMRINNHYSSPEGTTTLIFMLPQTPIRQVNILLGNSLNPKYEGQLEASIDYVKVANWKTGHEIVADLTPEEWYSNTNIIVEGDLDSTLVEALQAMGSLNQSISPPSITKEGDWAYSVQVASTEPFILSLTQSFNEGWHLQAPGASPIHFKTEAYGNAWLFPQGYQGEIQLYYAHTSSLKWLGIGTTSFWVIIALYFLTQPIVGWLRRRRHKA